MVSTDTAATTTTFNYSSSPQSQSSLTFSPSPSPSSPPPPTLVVSPCAACKILRRRCVEKCVLAPYFPPTEPLKFTTAHRVFGASNIIKFLQELPESQRADAVSSMVYEANARIRDPIYGSAGAICQLQKQVSDLQAQLAKTQAELVNMQCQHTNLLALIYMEMSQSQPQQEQLSQSPPLLDSFISSPPHMSYQISNGSFSDDSNNNNLNSFVWEPLWT
ncbi:LOB domain-containing protein 1-like [Telopea speciosissima]|uniref:LOB domain-containing protein 1-like n=1 Tax=Telopea speciosissima TaxID=54955 RepID=UPI001CC6FA06|nr:LOB domain-containing protein 1-like [Telopea speciosissima]